MIGTIANVAPDVLGPDTNTGTTAEQLWAGAMCLDVNGGAIQLLPFSGSITLLPPPQVIN